MSIEDGSFCPSCCQNRLQRVKKFYSIFRGRKHPDGVCGNCGAFYWERPDPSISLPVFKSALLVSGPAEQKEEREPTFKELLEEEEKRRKRRGKKKRYRRNRRQRRAMEAEKSRV